MPGRCLFLQESDALLTTPRALNNPEINIFDKSPGADMDIEEWQDWMRWDGLPVETAPIIFGQKDSFEGGLSSYNVAEVEISPLPACSAGASFEDAPFEFDDSVNSSQLLSSPQIPMDLRKFSNCYTILTAAEQQSLQDIAMPYRSLAQVKLSSESSSPADTTTTPSPSPSPEPKTRIRKAKKRKSSMTDGEPSTSLCQSRKRGHNAIEKRYRTNLNDKISCLREGIPPLWRRSSTDSKSGNEGENSDNEATDKKTGQQKYGKADILTRALEYIQHLESTSARLGDEVGVLKKRVEAFEMLAMSGSIIVSKGAPAPNGLLTPKTETLESIQEDFKHIKHESGSTSAAGGRRNSRKLSGKWRTDSR